MEDSQRFPHVPKELVDAMAKLWPLTPPDPKQPIAEVWFEAGRQSLIRRLQHEVNVQSKNVLDSK